MLKFCPRGLTGSHLQERLVLTNMHISRINWSVISTCAWRLYLTSWSRLLSLYHNIYRKYRLANPNHRHGDTLQGYPDVHSCFSKKYPAFTNMTLCKSRLGEVHVHTCTVTYFCKKSNTTVNELKFQPKRSRQTEQTRSGCSCLLFRQAFCGFQPW